MPTHLLLVLGACPEVYEVILGHEIVLRKSSPLSALSLLLRKTLPYRYRTPSKEKAVHPPHHHGSPHRYVQFCPSALSTVTPKGTKNSSRPDSSNVAVLEASPVVVEMTRNEERSSTGRCLLGHFKALEPKININSIQSFVPATLMSE
jgi:hypothetical protein